MLHYWIKGDPMWDGAFAIDTDAALIKGQVALMRQRGQEVDTDSLARADVEGLLRKANRQQRHWTMKVKLPTGQTVTTGLLREAYERRFGTAKLGAIL